MQIRFIKPHKVQQGDGRGPQYKVDDVVDFAGSVEETYAHKYIRLGLAVAHVPAPAGEKPKQKDEAETIELRTVEIGEAKLVYVEREWPKVAKIADDLLVPGASEHIAVADNKLTISVQNGIAVYEIGQIKKHVATCSLIESTFEAPPAP